VWQADNAWPNSFRALRFYPAVEYIQLNRVRMMLIQQMDEAIAGVDAYITPPFWGSNLLITNLTGHPAVVFPIGFSEEGTPTTITLMGHLFDEKTILEAAHLLQEANGVHKVFPERFVP
jgi:Asp-tRNA(Asn)/Glu-tRNA(Gln) amidotransferase A subunit family amidase